MARRPDDGSHIGLLQVTTFVSTTDRFVMPPMLVAIALDLGVPLAAAVQAAGAYFLAYGLMQPVWGVVSDRLGRVRTLRATLLLAGLASIASAFVATPLLLGVTRAAAGAFFGAAYPSTLIYVGDTVALPVRQPAIARLMVGVALGAAVASATAGVLADVASWRLGFVATGGAALVLVVVLRRLPEPAQPEATRASPLAMLGAVARSRVTLFVLALSFVEGMVLLGALTILPPASEAAGATSTLAGLLTGVYGVSVYLSSRMVRTVSVRLHPAWLLGGGSLVLLVAMLLLALSQGPVAAAVAVLLIGVAWVSMHSTLQTWATEVLPGARATVISLFAGALFAGSAVTAALVAAPAQAGQYDLIFLAGAALAMPLGVAATWGRWRWHRPAPGAPPAPTGED
ncbi:MFS transporter [Nocardioides sp. GXQ0305]|uniref:MFS transporter n=1 Tax=Nocardioides sp. GXQ0305 TaxID=3423912 RepID=UPI003D7E9480